jgi:hypothetical protein
MAVIRPPTHTGTPPPVTHLCQLQGAPQEAPLARVPRPLRGSAAQDVPGDAGPQADRACGQPSQANTQYLNRLRFDNEVGFHQLAGKYDRKLTVSTVWMFRLNKFRPNTVTVTHLLLRKLAVPPLPEEAALSRSSASIHATAACHLNVSRGMLSPYPPVSGSCSATNTAHSARPPTERI